MPTLIHLNGPSGVGKSTLAQRYVDEHPGVLNLDPDVVLSLIGGWRTDVFRFLGPARDLAVAMAGAHLRAGYDVVMPQLVMRIEEAERFQAAAGTANAGYLELALLADPEEQITRFRRRAEESHLDRHVTQAVDAQGGDDLLRTINGDFLVYLDHRPNALRLATSGAGSDASYARLSALLRSSSGRG